MKRSPIRRISKAKAAESEERARETELLHQLFVKIWEAREDESGTCYCFETGTPMQPWRYKHNTACYDHVLEKNSGSYPQYKYNEKNIVIVLPEVHTRKHQDIDNTPKIKAYREKLLSLHYENKLEED